VVAFDGELLSEGRALKRRRLTDLHGECSIQEEADKRADELDHGRR